VKLAELDEVKVANALTSTAQSELAKIAPFADMAYRTIHDEKFFISLLLDEIFPAVEQTRANATSSAWISHLRLMRKWGIIVYLTVKPELCISSYFAILKSNGCARTIFAGGQLSRLFKRPAPVNLPHIPVILSILSDLLRGKKFYFLSGDLRHFFHQISIAPELVKFFSVHCMGEIFGYTVLPMGWSHSPRLAQSFAWAALLGLASAENGLSKAAADFLDAKPEHPPSFMMLHDARGVAVGLVVIWIDNFLVWCVDNSIITEMSKTWTEMNRRWGLVWGEKTLWHPKQLTAEIADENPKSGVALGIQFSRKVKRGRSEVGDHLIWRLKPKTAAKALEFESRSFDCWTCRAIAGVVGSAVWQAYISCEPLANIHDDLELSSRVGTHARAHGWNSTFRLDEADRSIITSTLIRIRTNRWFGTTTAHDWSQITIVASDATLLMGAWVTYDETGARVSWTNWPWTGISLKESIFVLELRAAIAAIMACGVTGGVCVIITDNTAAAAVLRSMYSSTMIGRQLLKELHEWLASKNIFLVVAGIAGLSNDADSPTRDDPKCPQWCEARRHATFETGKRALHGCDRLRLNPITCDIGHVHEETEVERSEDSDCDGLSSSISRLMKSTSLDGASAE
jgi:hypothetical protein